MLRYSKIAAAILALCICAVYFICFSPFAYSLREPADKIRMLYPHFGGLWLHIRDHTLSFLYSLIFTCALYLSGPILIRGTLFIRRRKKEILLSCLSVLFALFLCEVILRILDYEPGQIENRGSFRKVDQLVLNEAYIADADGMTRIDPVVASKLKDFLHQDFKTESDIEEALHRTRDRWRPVGFDFRSLTEDYARVIAHLDHSPFAVWHSSLLRKPHYDSLDSLIINYVHDPINKDGFRSIPFRRHSSKKRVLLIGDSFTYGFTTTNKVHAFYDLLLSRGFEVYNTGLNDSDPPQYEAVAHRFIPSIQPDIVVVNFYLGNDIQYYRQHFGPYQTYNYRTNAGYLQSCPLGVPMRDMNEAYTYAVESSFIPTDSSLFNRLCSQTVITTLLWDQLKDKLHLYTKSGLIQRFEARARQCETDSPDANDRMARIKKLCEDNGAAFVLAIIPVKPLGQRPMQYVSSDPKLFPGMKYFESHTLTAADYCTGPDMHFNESGHQKYADFLASILDSISTRQPTQRSDTP